MGTCKRRSGPAHRAAGLDQLVRTAPAPQPDCGHPRDRHRLAPAQPHRTGPHRLPAPALADPSRQQPHPAGDARAGGTRTALDPGPARPPRAPDGAAKRPSRRASAARPKPPLEGPLPQLEPAAPCGSSATALRPACGTNSCNATTPWAIASPSAATCATSSKTASNACWAACCTISPPAS